jgi:hypothetical protein
MKVEIKLTELDVEDAETVKKVLAEVTGETKRKKLREKSPRNPPLTLKLEALPTKKNLLKKTSTKKLSRKSTRIPRPCPESPTKSI